MADEINDLEKLLVIDEEHMDVEWANQPIRYIQVVRVCARTQAEVSLHKIQADALEAELTLKYKVDGIVGVDRPTVEAIKAAVSSNEKMIVTWKALVELEQRLELLEGLKKAFEMRERSLKYIQIMDGLPLTDEDRELGRQARNNILKQVL